MNPFVQVFEEEKHNADPAFVFASICKSIAKRGDHDDLVALTQAYINHTEEDDHARTQIA